MSLIVFVGVNLVGDPVDMLINPEADQAEIDRVIRDLGLDRPVSEQYWYFVLNAFQGDLGRSFIFGEPALKLIVQRMPATMELGSSFTSNGRCFWYPARNLCWTQTNQ
jgi:peptide/nickel transport system permease protein